MMPSALAAARAWCVLFSVVHFFGLLVGLVGFVQCSTLSCSGDPVGVDNLGCVPLGIGVVLPGRSRLHAILSLMPCLAR